jgi:hypothetical protein
MWHKVINENKFISLLYDEVPELINVNIINVKLEDQGRKVSLLFGSSPFSVEKTIY